MITQSSCLYFYEFKISTIRILESERKAFTDGYKNKNRCMKLSGVNK